jgi:hypothetical protein
MARNALAELAPLFDALAAVIIRGEVPGPELLARIARARPTLAEVAPLPARTRPSDVRNKKNSNGREWHRTRLVSIAVGAGVLAIRV